MAENASSDVLVSFKGVQKSYDGENLIVKDLNLDIRKGEFLTLLGPSGSGKTTSLMMLAGFETPTAGEILLAGRAINNVPPHKRDIGMVFQNYALFPHMTVAENLAFPLSVRNLSKTDISERVKRVLNMVQLETFAQRYPGQLSGGQQQRVAIARAVVNKPRLLLLDEPFSALDAITREEMQAVFLDLWQASGITTMLVTPLSSGTKTVWPPALKPTSDMPMKLAMGAMAARMRMTCELCDCWKAAASPAKLPRMEAGMPMRALASAMALEASRIHGGVTFASIARPMSSTTSSLAATKGKST